MGYFAYVFGWFFREITYVLKKVLKYISKLEILPSSEEFLFNYTCL